MTNAEIRVDMDAKCADCGKGGRCGNGLCLGCTTKAIKGERMKSSEGAVVAARFYDLKQNFRKKT